MIKLRDHLLVSAHMIVSIELGTEAGQPCIEVYTPDGQYWSIIAKDLHVPEINDGLLIALANEIDRQLKEMGVAAFMDDKVKAAIDNRIEAEAKGDWPAPKGTINFDKLSRDLDDEIPF